VKSEEKKLKRDFSEAFFIKVRRYVYVGLKGNSDQEERPDTSGV